MACALTACVSFQIVGDPRIGALSRERLPVLIKSVRCELATFYTAEVVHKQRLIDHRKRLVSSHWKYLPIDDLARLNHFDLDHDAYSNITLDVKLQQNMSVPGTSTNINNVLSTATGNGRTLAVGPSIQAQATYDNAAVFAIPQNATVRTPKEELSALVAQSARVGATSPAEVEAKCFANSVGDDYDGMAAGRYPNLELLERIRVDAGAPLASWLQEASRTVGISRNLMMDAHAVEEGRQALTVESTYISQAIDIGQLAYTFTVQVTGGLDAKFSLVTARVNPLAADVSAGIQQTGTLTLYVNGYQALAALSARSALVLIKPPPSAPGRVIIVGDERGSGGPTTQAKPRKEVTIRGRETIGGKVEGALKDRPASADATALKDDLKNQLRKNQSAPSQAARTEQAIKALRLPESVTTDLIKELKDNTVTLPAQKTIRPPRPTQTYNPTQANDDRGYFRAPVGIPLQ